MQHLRSSFVGMLQLARSLDGANTLVTSKNVYDILEEIGLRKTWPSYAALVQKQA